MSPTAATQDKQNEGNLFLMQKELKEEFWNKGWAIIMFYTSQTKDKNQSLSTAHTRNIEYWNRGQINKEQIKNYRF